MLPNVQTSLLLSFQSPATWHCVDAAFPSGNKDTRLIHTLQQMPNTRSTSALFFKINAFYTTENFDAFIVPCFSQPREIPRETLTETILFPGSR
jgi:hypothetical protein